MPFRNLQLLILYSFQHFGRSINPMHSSSYENMAMKICKRKGCSIPDPLLHPLFTLCSLQIEEEVNFSLPNPNSKA